VERSYRQSEGFQSAFTEALEPAEQVSEDSSAPHSTYLEDALRLDAPYTAPHHPQDDVRGRSLIGLFGNFSLKTRFQ
jgi:hypothetical protein